MGYAIKEYINNHPYGHIISWRRFLLTNFGGKLCPFLSIERKSIEESGRQISTLFFISL
jgi:hypothetical protein